MSFQYAKAISGGTPIDDDEMERLAQTHLQALRESFRPQIVVEKSQDVMEHRLAEELRLVARMLDLVEQELRDKGNTRGADEIQRSEDAIEDLAEMVEADDRCDALENIDSDRARRLTRRSFDGTGGPCDNRRPSILKANSGQA
ncbi:hypothetical protein HME9302_01793 [Alteripontixanthobacter maritimus]|uniref:Uncharacterized protein n=1 Tax=Alteripontixanthobacter maritimus TaxID=2161824 RepID=A0A369Q6U3_9SPHN|nr:hypothetical protein [Alteripontixanthobacter maritimus]RDC60581.1 hypothetical protein HME9302_01793 [Alteripontixanthobacter maritimus]